MEKISAFRKKLFLWKEKLPKKKFTAFLSLNQFIEDTQEFLMNINLETVLRSIWSI